MKKKIIYIVLLVVISLVGFLGYKTITKIKHKEKISEQLQTMPDFQLLSMDSTVFTRNNLDLRQPTVIVFFNSECSHCQYEAKAITENISKFVNVNLLMMSSEPLTRIRAFVVDYELDLHREIYLTQIREEVVFDTFGSISVPHIFIYNQQQKLVKEFKGEVKIEAILKYL